MLGLPTHLERRLYFPAKRNLTSRGVSHNSTGVLTSLNKPEFQMAIPAITREYTTGACRNSIKLMRLPLRRNKRPDSPAFHAQGFRVPNQRSKEPRFPWWNWRESQSTRSQQEKYTDVTSGMQNKLVYPKSTQDEAYFPFIEYIAISHSTSYRQMAWHPLQQSRDSLRHPSQVYRNIYFSKGTGWKLRATHII